MGPCHPRLPERSFSNVDRCCLLYKEVAYNVLSSVVRDPFFHKLFGNCKVISVRNVGALNYGSRLALLEELDCSHMPLMEEFGINSLRSLKLRQSYRLTIQLRQECFVSHVIRWDHGKKLNPSFLANSAKASAMPSCVKPS